MQKRAGTLVFSPSDLCRFYETEFGSWMDRLRVERPGAAGTTPDENAPEQKLLADLGLAHERRYLESLRAAGKRVWEPPGDLASFAEKSEATLAAMRAGHDVVYQAALCHDAFEGYADFLYRVPIRSALGAWSYDVAEHEARAKAEAVLSGPALRLREDAGALAKGAARAAVHRQRRRGGDLLSHRRLFLLLPGARTPIPRSAADLRRRRPARPRGARRSRSLANRGGRDPRFGSITPPASPGSRSTRSRSSTTRASPPWPSSPRPRSSASPSWIPPSSRVSARRRGAA